MAKQVKEQPAVFQKEQLKTELRFEVADHATELLWGQGFNITHENEAANKRLQELLKYNRTKEMFPQMERFLSLYGNVYMTIDLVDGNPTWTIADPVINSQGSNSNVPTSDSTLYGVGRALVTDVVAVIWKKMTFGTYAYRVKEVWDDKKVKRYFFGENNKKVKIGDVIKNIPPEMTIQDEWEHNMGFVPVVWFKNLPVHNRLAQPDDYKAHAMQTVHTQTVQQLYHELETNRTRIIGNMSPQAQKNISKMFGGTEQITKTDFLVNVGDPTSTNGEIQTQLIPLMGDPKITEYWKGISEAKDEFFKLCNYSPLSDGIVEKTAVEAMQMKTSDYQTTKKKRTQRSLEVTELLDKSLKIDAKHGFGDIYGDLDANLSVEILENKVMDAMGEISNYQVLVDNHFMARSEAIAKLRGITVLEAKAILKDIMQESQEWEAVMAPKEDEEDKDKEKDKE